MVISVFILKEIWRGGDQCLERGHADESNFLAVERMSLCVLSTGVFVHLSMKLQL